MKQLSAIILLIASILFSACQKDYDHETVLCIPVYGQSLALGEEAERMTDFDSLAAYADGRIVTENLDHSFGYFYNNERPHMSLNNMTPRQAASCMGKIQKKMDQLQRKVPRKFGNSRKSMYLCTANPGND